MRIPGGDRWKSARKSCVVLSIIAMSVLASLARTSEFNELEAESHIESTLRYSSGFSIGQFRAATVDSVTCPEKTGHIVKQEVE